MNDFKKKTDEQFLLEQVKKIHEDYHNGFFYADINVGLSKAIEYIKKCEKSICVIGTAKSEHLAKASDYEHIIRAYMSATLDTLEKKNIIYKRITNYEASDNLIEHLRKCLELNRNGTKAHVMVMDKFITANTFLVVDDKFLFISPTPMDKNLEISKFCHYTTQPVIIKNLFRSLQFNICLCRKRSL